MLLQGYGVDRVQLRRRSAGQRAFARLAAVRVEVLGDRLLLSVLPVGSSAVVGPSIISHGLEAGSDSAHSVPRSMGLDGQTSALALLAVSTASNSTGVTDPTSSAKQSSVSHPAGAMAKAPVNVNPRQPLAPASPAGPGTFAGNYIGPCAGNITGAALGASTTPAIIGGQLTVTFTPPVPLAPNGPHMLSGISPGGGAPSGVGRADAHFSVYVPAPIPAGVPVGGIFQTSIHSADRGYGGGISSDSVAVDSSSLVPVTDAVSVFAPTGRRFLFTSRRGGTGRPTETLLEFERNPPPSLAASPRMLSGQHDGTLPGRVELPDLSASDTNLPAPLVENLSDAERSSSTSTGRDAGEISTAAARRSLRWLVTRIAACGAACSVLSGTAIQSVAMRRHGSRNVAAAPIRDPEANQANSPG
jgi:hypothetical protein